MRTHPDKPVPMSLAELWNGIEVPPQMAEFVAQLLQRKATSKELGLGPRAAILDAMIEHEISSARSQLDKLPPVDHDILDAADAVFLELLGVEVTIA